MNLPTLLDVALGLTLVFLILASLGSLLAELWAAYRKLRHGLLLQTVDRLLGPNLAGKFWKHSLIVPLFEPAPRDESKATPAPATGLAVVTRAISSSAETAYRYGVRKPWHLVRPRRAEAPAYLDAQLFATTVLDIATGKGERGRLPNEITAWRHAIEQTIEQRPGTDDDLQDHLLALLRQVPADSPDVGAALKAALAKWFEEAMQRTSGVYRRKTQKALFVIGIILALALNADALRIAQVLYQNPALRSEVASQAEQLYRDRVDADGKLKPVADDATTRQQLQTYSAELRDLTKIGFPLGWMPHWRDNFISLPEARLADDGKAVPAKPGLAAYAAKLVGLLASALAVTLGAPFWFDVLGRIVKLRSSAGAAAEKPKEPAATSVAGPGSGAPAVAALSGTSAPPPAALPDATEALGAAGTAFDPARAYWVAEFANRAYEPDDAPAGLDAAARRMRWEESLRAWLGPQGYRLVATFDATDPESKVDTQAFLALGASAAVLAFRGTEKKLIDWKTDADFAPVEGTEFQQPGGIHRGFARALEAAWPDIEPQLVGLLGRRVLLHVTGHSLGAALATLAALRCARRKETTTLVHTVHTFGSPRVGDSAFASAFQAELGGHTYRVVNNEDLVTRVPTRVQGYEHVGELIYIDETGRLQRDLGYWYRFLNFTTNALGDLQAAVKTTVKDHSMHLYCGFLKKAAQHHPQD